MMSLKKPWDTMLAGTGRKMYQSLGIRNSYTHVAVTKDAAQRRENRVFRGIGRLDW